MHPASLTRLPHGKYFPITCQNPYLVESPQDYESLTTLNSGGSTTNFQPNATQTASELHSYLLDPWFDEEFIFGLLVAGEDFPETFDDSFNFRFPRRSSTSKTLSHSCIQPERMSSRS